jgi:hypothetical protein
MLVAMREQPSLEDVAGPVRVSLAEEQLGEQRNAQAALKLIQART